MDGTQTAQPMVFRTLFLSDLHLGSPWCRARNLLHLLESVDFEKLYLVGDILDNWHLRRGHRPSRAQLQVWEKLLEISRRRDVVYLVGNHDAFLDEGQPYHALFRQAFAGMSLCRQAVHRAADGRQYLVEHGDAHDAGLRSGALTWAATLAYEVSRNILSRLAAATSQRLISPARTEARVLRWQTKLTDFVRDSRLSLLAGARRLGLDGVICGHTHLAALQECEGLIYANCGYWTGPCHVLAETATGELQLRLWGKAWEQPELPGLLAAAQTGNQTASQTTSPAATLGQAPAALASSLLVAQVAAHISS